MEIQMRQKLSALALTILATACGRGLNESALSKAATDSDLAFSAESVVTAVGSLPDNESGSSIASYPKAKDPFSVVSRSLQEFLLPQAYASTCQTARSQSCSGGVRTVTQSDCDIPGTSATLSGTVTLTYSNNTCSMSSAGDQVARTLDITLSGPRGGALHIFSDNQTDYRGNVIGGGGILTRLSATTWKGQIQGKNKILSLNGKPVMNHSIRTLADLSFANTSGNLGRAGRELTAGSVEVAHNLAKFVATYSVGAPLQWSVGSCFPTSGVLDVNYTGSVTGSAQITFNSGTITYTRNGNSRTIDVSYCE